MKYVQIMLKPIYGDYGFKCEYNESNQYGWYVEQVLTDNFAVGFKSKDKDKRFSWIEIKNNKVLVYDSAMAKHPISISRGDYISHDIIHLIRNALSVEYIEIEKYARKRFINYYNDEYNFLSEEDRRAKKTWEWQKKSVITL